MNHINLFASKGEFESSEGLLPETFVAHETKTKTVVFSSVENVTVEYDLALEGDTLFVGTGYLYRALSAIYIVSDTKTQLDIDDLVIEGGGASGGVAARVGIPARLVAKANSNRVTVEFSVDGIFRKRAMLGDAPFVSVKIPYKNSVQRHANDVGYVDLGLPSGKLWATKNVGADTMTDTGGYYQYAGLIDCEFFPNTDVPYAGEGKNVFTKYNPGERLEREDDVVAYTLGGSWSMPSAEDFEELIANTTVEKTALNGIAGYKFVSRYDDRKFIFIPVSGFYQAGRKNVGDQLFIGASDIGTLAHNRRYLYDKNAVSVGETLRSMALTVRGVL